MNSLNSIAGKIVQIFKKVVISGSGNASIIYHTSAIFINSNFRLQIGAFRMEKLKIVIFGLGSIGKRHARIIQDNFNHEIYAFRSRKDGPKNEFGFPEIYSFEELDLIKPDLALITNPTDSHLRYAQECAKRGMHLFIEKPLSSTNDGLDQFCDIVKKNKVNV